MPDFTLVDMQQCLRTRCESPKWSPRGGCWPYLKSAPGFEHGTCKHMCGWHQMVGPEVQTEAQRQAHECPRCGSRTETVQVAV